MLFKVSHSDADVVLTALEMNDRQLLAVDPTMSPL